MVSRWMLGETVSVLHFRTRYGVNMRWQEQHDINSLWFHRNESRWDPSLLNKLYRNYGVQIHGNNRTAVSKFTTSTNTEQKKRWSFCWTYNFFVINCINRARFHSTNQWLQQNEAIEISNIPKPKLQFIRNVVMETCNVCYTSLSQTSYIQLLYTGLDSCCLYNNNEKVILLFFIERNGWKRGISIVVKEIRKS